MDFKNRRKFIWRSIIFMAFALRVFGGDAKAAENLMPLEAKLPANTPFVVAGDDLAATCTAWQATQLGKLLCGELFVPVRKVAAKRGVATPLYLRPCFGFDWGDLSLYSGPAALAVVPLSDGKFAVAWVFPTPNQPVEKLFAAGRAYFREHGYEETADTLGNAKLSVFNPPAKNHRSDHPTYLTSESVAVAAGNRESVAAIWKQFNGQAKSSLGTLKDFNALASNPAKDTSGSTLRCWLRPMELWTALRGGSKPVPLSDWLSIARRQGGESIRAVGGQIAFPTSGPTDLDLRGRVLVSQPLSGAAKLLDFTAAPPPAIPVWLGGNVASVSLWACNVPEAVTAFGHLFDEYNEPGPKGQGVFQEMMAALHDDPEGPQVDLLRDLFPHLGPGLLQATDCRKPGTKDKSKTTTRRTLFIVECRDRDKVAKTLERFYRGDKDVREKTTGQDLLWTIPPGRSLLFEGSDKSLSEVRAILVSGKSVFFATEPEMLANRLSGRSDSSLIQSAAYKAVSKWWQAQANRGPRDAGFVQLAFWLEPSYDAVLARTPSNDWATAMLRLLLTGSHRPSADFPVEELPPYVKIAPLLPSMGSVREKNTNGWDINMSTLRGLQNKS
jgi:hypothetical protein